MKVEPQEPVFPHDGARIEEHAESDIIKDTTTMLKGLNSLLLASTLMQTMRARAQE